LDTAALLKVLPRFHGAHSKLETPLKALLAWCRNPEAPDLEGIEMLVQGVEDTDAVLAALSAVSYYFPCTAERALRMIHDLYTEGFTAFGYPAIWGEGS
jgi:5-methylcytosine-specific restriction protein B